MEELAGQTVVVIGGSAGIGLETARRARAEGADVVLAARNPDRLEQAARDVGAERTAAFDVNDTAALESFFRDLSAIDHVMLTGPGPRYGPLLEMDPADVRDVLSDHVTIALAVTRNAVGKMRPGGTLLFMGGTGGRRIDHRLGIAAAGTAALPPFVATLALEIAPVRVNLIAPGFVDTPLTGGAAPDTPDQAGRRSRRCRRARRPHHDQHRAHRCHVRHRRRPAVRPVASRPGAARPQTTRNVNQSAAIATANAIGVAMSPRR
jgi:NAD(P)-dependent dehydrogenase (short-subunit alcohol dehydrogenase family)